MLSTRRRSLTAIAAGALVLTALAGCGSDDKKAAHAEATRTSSPSETPTATETPTESAGSSDLGPVAGPGERLTKDNLVSTIRAAMRDKKTAHISMKIGSSIGSEADVRFSGDKTDMKMSMSMGATNVVVILVDGAVYYQQQPGGKFTKIDKDTPGMGNIVDMMSGFNPESSLAAMKGAVQKVEYQGTERVDGDQLSKYAVTVDTSAMAGVFGGGTTGSAGNLPKTVTYALYVDRDHLLRRIDTTVSGQHIEMVATNWGKPVDIEAPPASQLMSQ